jgi:hypothetical protein
MNTRSSLDQLGLGLGKKARLHRILHEHGVGNGTAIFLPYDHGLEHGPRDFAGHAESGDPRHVIRLAVEGGFNGVALQIGLAGKFYWEYAGEVPLVLKLNGKTDIPSPADPVSPVNATVEEAVRLGADAVGYTLYVGTPGQERDFAQYLRVRADAEACRSRPSPPSSWRPPCRPSPGRATASSPTCTPGRTRQTGVRPPSCRRGTGRSRGRTGRRSCSNSTWAGCCAPPATA